MLIFFFCREENVDFSKKVYVGGIPYYSSEEDIRSFFDSCGTLTELDCMTFPETGKFRGIAFLTFKVSLKHETDYLYVYINLS